VGDRKTDDIDAIAATHAFANQQGLPVKAGEGATYYISGKDRTAFIQTDTDFGTLNLSSMIQKSKTAGQMFSRLVPVGSPSGYWEYRPSKEIRINLILPYPENAL
jgi:hypothetical protein